MFSETSVYLIWGAFVIWMSIAQKTLSTTFDTKYDKNFVRTALGKQTLESVPDSRAVGAESGSDATAVRAESKSDTSAVEMEYGSDTRAVRPESRSDTRSVRAEPEQRRLDGGGVASDQSDVTNVDLLLPVMNLYEVGYLGRGGLVCGEKVYTRVISRNFKLGGCRHMFGGCKHAQSANLHKKTLNFFYQWLGVGGVVS